VADVIFINCTNGYLDCVFEGRQAITQTNCQKNENDAIQGCQNISIMEQ